MELKDEIKPGDVKRDLEVLAELMKPLDPEVFKKTFEQIDAERSDD